MEHRILTLGYLHQIILLYLKGIIFMILMAVVLYQVFSVVIMLGIVKQKLLMIYVQEYMSLLY